MSLTKLKHWIQTGSLTPIDDVAVWAPNDVTVADAVAAMPVLPRRWQRLMPHAKQLAFQNSPKRFNVVPAGRRSGKTERAKRRAVLKAIRYMGKLNNPRVILGAPTHGQAKRIYWADLKALTPRALVAGEPSESELSITLRNGVVMQVTGLDKPQRVEGNPILHILLDEYADMKADVWAEHVRPAISDPLEPGSADFIGVPEGRNHFFDLYQQAEVDTTGDWAAFTWHSQDILQAAEIEQARRDLDDLTFRQEYCAEFVVFQGLVYYPFDPSVHIVDSLPYEPHRELILCFDFNVSPGVCVIAQEFEGFTGVIDNVHIPRDSNTPLVCAEIRRRYAGHNGIVSCYGDPTGGNRGTAKVQGSDWDLIRRDFRLTFGERAAFYVRSGSPPERSRVNAVNSHLLSTAGIVRTKVSRKAAYLAKDFQRVQTKQGTTGVIDKRDGDWTHATDAWGYFVEYKYPVRSGAQLEVSGF